MKIHQNTTLELVESAMKIHRNTTFEFSENEKAAIIATLNLVEYPKEKVLEVYKRLDCKRVKPEYWRPLFDILQILAGLPVEYEDSCPPSLNSDGWAAYTMLFEIIAQFEKMGIIESSYRICDKLDSIMDD